ncbi:cation diffusion facilitator family transporter [Exiguobacterium flavidum]|uniref:cation diffusion facilitator family transporter n=1 Tax=Exiguobacterium flavidum TaxID=2184695 RepID=UPI000DF781E0|nr:cation diffusion facilitator family transporter [Exiguobacterium flavidum]
MAHSHHHDHGHAHTKNRKALGAAFILIALFMVIEVAGGIWTHSLALLSDAGHMLSDAAALGLSFLALLFGVRPSNRSKTFGYKRFETIAAFVNGLTLIVIAVFITVEAYHRFVDPPRILSKGMLLIAVIGLVVNIIAALILRRGDKDTNLNVRSAFLHVLGDLLGSAGAIVAALLLIVFGWQYADPVASIVVAMLIAFSGVRVTRDAFHILMEGAPERIDGGRIEARMREVDGVIDLHALRIWSLASDMPLFSCHLVIREDAQEQVVLSEVRRLLHDEFGIGDATIQIERESSDCTKTAAHH